MQVRLTKERWEHIIHPEEGHPEVSAHHHDIFEVIAEPDAIYEGTGEELIAAKEIRNGRYLMVIYRETNRHDGFIITAWITSKIKQIQKRKKIWPILD